MSGRVGDKKGKTLTQHITCNINMPVDLRDLFYMWKNKQEKPKKKGKKMR